MITRNRNQLHWGNLFLRHWQHYRKWRKKCWMTSAVELHQRLKWMNVPEFRVLGMTHFPWVKVIWGMILQTFFFQYRNTIITKCCGCGKLNSEFSLEHALEADKTSLTSMNMIHIVARLKVPLVIYVVSQYCPVHNIGQFCVWQWFFKIIKLEYNKNVVLT